MVFVFTRLESLDSKKLYKVIQLVIDEQEETYFVEDGYNCFHADILAEILKLHNLPLTIIKKKLSGKEYVLQGDGFIVSGMGGARVLSEKRVLLFGNSAGFDIGVSESHAEKLNLTKKKEGWRVDVSLVSKERLAS